MWWCIFFPPQRRILFFHLQPHSLPLPVMGVFRNWPMGVPRAQGAPKPQPMHKVAVNNSAFFVQSQFIYWGDRMQWGFYALWALQYSGEKQQHVRHVVGGVGGPFMHLDPGAHCVILHLCLKFGASYKDTALCLLFVVHVPDRWSSGQTTAPSGGRSSPLFLLKQQQRLCFSLTFPQDGHQQEQLQVED